ncbi:MAG: selenocysteine-specific translation elongation factor [Calditrichaeota bacterium]|nr:selenocysteine-specific translation elongation factor [Calditrichota bacterium]
MAHVIIGTAGHIDHGKSALVKALTGTDPDRLKEEKERGLTIDLGFAFLGERAAFIDVPGHERFVKNMVAGVSTVDAVLFVVAADDGVMPQTREHLDILTLLELKRGIIALTKIDLVDSEWVAMVTADVRNLVQGTFLQDAPIIPVSSVTGEGIAQLRQALDELIASAPSRSDQGVFWLPIDRSFTMKGFGTVVTGSVLSGTAKVGDELELHPQRRLVRVRGLQTHGRDVSIVRAGDRAALNLVGVHKEEVQRGDVLASPGYFSPSTLLDVRLRLLPAAGRPLRHNTRVRLHVGTRELMARVSLLEHNDLPPGGSTFAQLRLEEIITARRMDRFVIRQYSPPMTIGGGVILDANARPHRRFRPEVLQQMAALEKDTPEETLMALLQAQPLQPLSLAQLAKGTGLAQPKVEELVGRLVQNGTLLKLGSERQPTYALPGSVVALKEAALAELQRYHVQFPLRAGMPRAELREAIGRGLDQALFAAALDELRHNGEVKENAGLVALATHRIVLSPADQALREELMQALLAAGFSPPSTEELARASGRKREDVERVLAALHALGEVLRLEESIYLPQTLVAEAQRRLADYFATHEEVTVSAFREMLGTSRRYALPLLLHFDEQGFTERRGEARVLKKKDTAQ